MRERQQGQPGGVELAGVAVGVASRSSSGMAWSRACPRSQIVAGWPDATGGEQKHAQTDDGLRVVTQCYMGSEQQADARQAQFDGIRPQRLAIALGIERPKPSVPIIQRRNASISSCTVRG